MSQTTRRRLRTIAPLIALFALTLPALGSAPSDQSNLPLNRRVGQRFRNFNVKDVTTGRNVSLYGQRGKKAVVLVFLGTDCPVANLYVPRLIELNKEYKDRGVAFLGMNSNAHDTVDQIAAHAKEAKIDFPVLKDEGNMIADGALVERTCEAIVLDGMAFMRYRGAIDDQYGAGTRKPEATRHYLKEALEEVLSSGRVDTPATAVAGCLIDRVDAKPTITTSGNASRIRPADPAIVDARKDEDAKEFKKSPKVTYAGEVAAIVQNKCQNCHRPGEVAPFSLLTFDDARKHAAMIREVVDERRMPPWHADPRYGHFKNDRSLTSVERAALLAWVDQGTPLGDPTKLPPPRTFPEGWSIGTPDVVFELPETQTVPAQGAVEYVHVRVPTKFKEDVWVEAAEARPGDRSVVHHIIVYQVPLGGMLRGGLDPTSDAHLCGYAPGDMPSVYPKGAGKKITAGSSFIFEIHYTPTGKVKTDKSKVGLIFAKGSVKHKAYTMPIPQGRFEIPPGDGNYEVASEFRFDKDVHVLSFMPHMHLRGKDFKYDIEFPDGRKETLLSVPAYDFGWQSYYTLAESLAVPKGTIIRCLAHFDNSKKNPYNPDPTKAVRWGEQTWEEMMIGYVDYIDDVPTDATGKEKTASRPSTPGTTVLRALSRMATRQKPNQPARKPAP